MAILLGIDFETTGLDPLESEIIEIGAILWDTESQKPIEFFSTLVKPTCPLPEVISEITGIENRLLEFGKSLDIAMVALCNMADKADSLVAHNASFEKAFIDGAGYAFSIPWIDTMTDLPYPPGQGKGTLNDIAMCHGIFNPMPHRALTDVLTMMQVLAKYDFGTVRRYAQTKNITLSIRFPYDDTGEKNRAVKALGYRWNPENKTWDKQVKAFLEEIETGKAQKAGFNPVAPPQEMATPF